MKTIDLSAEAPTLAELLRLAGEGSVILRTPQGREFVLAELEDLDAEVAQVLKNAELVQLLDERSRESKTHTLDQVRKELQLD